MASIPALLLARADRDPDAVAFYVRQDADPFGTGVPAAEHPGWLRFTFGTTLPQLSRMVQTLHGLGVGEGVVVAILAETSHVWASVDMATLCLGGVTVGVYPTLTPDQVIAQLRHAEARVLVVENEAQYARIAPLLDQLPDLAHVRSIWPGDGLEHLVLGSVDMDFLRARVARLTADHVATYVYTSGTTGEPKGAVLTHGNFRSVIEASRRALPVRPGDRSIVFLPLAHSLQRFALYRGLVEEAVGYYCPTLADLPEVIQLARPQVLVTVPRMLEKIKATAEAKAAERGPRAAAILDWAIRVGRARQHLVRHGQPVPLRLAVQHWIADRLVYRKVRQRLGGALRMLVSGGAALSVEVAEWFEALDIMVREGWGLTETCAPATTNREESYRLGTVGLPLDGVDVKLDDDGELLIRSPGNFRGYYKDPAATAAAFAAGGWFRTGDFGSIDPDGFVRVLGRKKAIIVTAGGKNIAPVPIEKAIEGGLVGQVVVVGDERPYLVALIAPDPEALAALAAQRGWGGEFADWARRPGVRAVIQEAVDHANDTLAPFQTIKGFIVVTAPFTVEAGELTPTLKLKRRVIRARYAAQITALYGG